MSLTGVGINPLELQDALLRQPPLLRIYLKLLMTLEEVLNLAKQLSVIDKVRLIEQIASEIEQSLEIQSIPRQSLWGLCADLGVAPSNDDIAEVRQAEWANFPRDDV
jgi:hypothetical protein